jgi:excisionase family DNA binding protein
LGLGAAAQYLGVHATTLRRWADRGSLPALLTPGGHRRFALADLQRFAAERRRLRPAAKLEAAWADLALQRTRQEIVSRQDMPWLAAFDERDRQHKRELGRRLLGVMLQFVALPEGGEALLVEAERIGRAHAENTLSLGLPLVEALQVMLFFRDTVVEAAIQMPAAIHARPEANLQLLRRIHRLLNVVQLAIAGAYEQAQR